MGPDRRGRRRGLQAAVAVALALAVALLLLVGEAAAWSSSAAPAGVRACVRLLRC